MVQTLFEPEAIVIADEEQLLREAVSSLTKAEELLRCLTAAKAECERELAKSNRKDPFKAVTGASSLDRAIASTKKMIETLGRTVETLGKR
ncbi:MAG TPA: hypothetical protein VG797_04605 [Phycisphaerales bacterium]|nr:hypothetical protein [Phycisphaerales bacterium]